MADPERRLGLLARLLSGGLGALLAQSARHPLVVLLLVLLVTAGLGAGLARIRFEENVLEILPRDHPDTLANINESRAFPGHYSYVEIDFKIDPEKWAEANARLPSRVPPETLQRDGADPSRPSQFLGAHNITDEVYLRGLEEYYADWARAPRYLPDGVAAFNVGWNAHVKLLNYTNSYNASGCAASTGTSCLDPAAYAFPGTDAQGETLFALDWATVYTSGPDEISSQASPDWSMTSTSPSPARRTARRPRTSTAPSDTWKR